jgi:hypothetical protein
MTCEFLELAGRALHESVNLFGAPTFTYKGTAYPAVINDLEVSQVLMEGGLLEELITIIIVSIRVLPAPPNVGDNLCASGKALRVNSVKRDEVSWEIHCTTAAV